MPDPYPSSWPKPAPLSKFGCFTRLYIKQTAYVMYIVGVNNKGHICDNLYNPTTIPLFAIELKTWNRTSIWSRSWVSSHVKLIFTDGEIYWSWRFIFPMVDVFGSSSLLRPLGCLGWTQLDSPINPSHFSTPIHKVSKEAVQRALALYASEAYK